MGKNKKTVNKTKNMKDNSMGLLFLFVIAVASYRLIEDWLAYLTDPDMAPFFVLILSLVVYTVYKYLRDKKHFWGIEQWFVSLLLIFIVFAYNM